MLTQKPVMASSAAAMATASRACCGMVDSGLPSSRAARPPALVTVEPGGRLAATPGGRLADPDEVASHHWVACAGGSESAVRMSWSVPRSMTRAPPLPGTVGNVASAATIFTLTLAPLTEVCTVEPTLALAEIGRAHV